MVVMDITNNINFMSAQQRVRRAYESVGSYNATPELFRLFEDYLDAAILIDGLYEDAERLSRETEGNGVA